MDYPIYLNKKQKSFYRAIKPYKMFLGGRGSGKTTTEGPEQYRSMVEMPRSKGFLASSTYAQLLNSTLPSIEMMWTQLGMIEGEDYVVGIKPPKTFDKCLDEPREYKNVISWANGRRIQLMSMDRPDLQRGGTFVDGAADEAALIPHIHITKVMIPSLRGMVREFNTPLRGVFRAYTSIPWKPSGYWSLDYELKAQSLPGMYHWEEANAYDNIDILGQDYLTRLEAELPYLEFLVEVMNERVRKVSDAFYHKFDAEKHTYSPVFDYSEGERGIIIDKRKYADGMKDSHYKRDKVIDLSFDFSGFFNCCTVWQEGEETDGRTKRRIEYCLRQLFVKSSEGKVAELVDKFCATYSNHAFKVVRLWGEPRGHDAKADTRQTMFEQIKERLVRQGWQVEIRVKPGQVKAHKERNYFMNEVLAETNPLLPILRFNDENCKDAIISMQVTGVRDDYQKDKSKESDRAFPQEHAPHFTDTCDYYAMQKHGHRVGMRASRPALSATMG
jgi:hypothetical protein